MNGTSTCTSQDIKAHKDIFSRSHINELVNKVKSAIENGLNEIVIDFEEIENIDIVGFGVLRTVQKISLTNSVHISLKNVRDNVKQIIKNSCLILDISNGGEEENLIHEEIALIA